MWLMRIWRFGKEGEGRGDERRGRGSLMGF